VRYIQITQREGGEGAGGKNNIRWDRASIVGAALGAVRVDHHETTGGRVEKTVRGEEVQCHNITPSEKAGYEGSRGQKGTINVKSNPWF